MNQHQFWRENVIVVVVEFLRKCHGIGNKYSNVRSFIFFRLGEGLTSFNKGNNATFSGEEKYYEAFRDTYFFEYAKKLEVKSRTRSVIVLESKGV